LLQTNAAGSLVLTNGYYLQGNLTERWTPAKGLTTFSYDQSGNVTNIDYAASQDISFTYDGLNQISTMIDAAGATTYTYNDNGELQSEDGPWA
jgi:YD repeat-containing protein